MADINDRLQQIVDERFGGSQTSFADALGKRQSSIANYLGQRKSLPSFEILKLMVERLGVDARWLLTGKEYQLNGVNATNSTLTGSTVVDSPIFIGVPSEIKDLVMRYEAIIAEKEERIKEKERLISEKDERIADLKERIDELKGRK